MIQNDPLVRRAEDILRGEDATPQAMFDLARQLKDDQHFNYARRLLGRARQCVTQGEDRAFVTRLRQQHALCTYKDPDLPLESRLDAALGILAQDEDLATTRDQETLGIAGSIYRKKWDAYAQRADLERSLSCYLRGYDQGLTGDLGYCGINAAFLLDVLAAQEAGAGDNSRRAQARQIREDIALRLPKLAAQPECESLNRDWWFHVTVAEALFGLGRYAASLLWLENAKRLKDVAGWQIEATARQFAALAQLSGAGGRPSGPAAPDTPWGVLETFAGTAAVSGAFAGKIGLALSGGGFRASLFHIGVLAKLAELDVLRHVEVLSCVSGGSIIGAHYYLEVRKLLQSKPDAEVTAQDYVEIVRRVERDFLAGVQKNIRTRVLTSVGAHLKLLLFPDASRTELVGELYEQHLYRRIEDGENQGARWLDALRIQPAGESAGFNPKYNNWCRHSKAPILVLNGTTLNTGHNWQFTASWMGEPPAGVDTQIDGNDRLRRMYYYEAPERYRRYRLGHAVAASSCVPGLFEPINLPDLYPDRTVRLVDGGVHDNQGISALLDQDCSLLLVSDASGQMESLRDPGSGALSALLRSNTILQSRVRQAEYHDLDARRRSSLLRGFMFVHLKKDLDVDPVDWVGCEDPVDASEEARPSLRRGELTCYGIRKDVQRLLAGIRTDLDSFHDVEACALMLSGYRMTEYEFPRSVPDFPATPAEPVKWRFLKIEEPLKRVRGVDAAHREVMRLLQVAGSNAFKIWQLSRPLKGLGWALLTAAAGLVAWACYRWANLPLLTPGRIGLAALALVLLGAAAAKIVRVARYTDAARQMVLGALGIPGALVAELHLQVFDRMYLRRGSLERLETLVAKGDVEKKAASAGPG